MNRTQQEMLAELRSNAQSMAQLASWQLALARDVEGKLADCETLGDAIEPSGDPVTRRRRGGDNRGD